MLAKMCTGTVSILTCGCPLIHYTSRCPSSLTKCEPCSKPSGEVHRLDDTCANCHPPFLVFEINRRHDQMRERMIAAMRGARGKEEVKQLQRVMEEAHVERGKDIRAANSVKWSGVVVWGPSPYSGTSIKESVIWGPAHYSGKFT